MEMPPDTLAAFGVNEVVVTVEPSVTTEQAASGSLGTHRPRSSNSNTASISSMLSVNSGAVSLIVLKRGSSIAPMHRILRTLSSISSIHLSSRSRKIAARAARTQGSSSPSEILAWDDKIMSVVGHIDEIHILSAVRAVPMVGYLSPSQICLTLQKCLEFSGQLFLLERTPQQCQPPRTGWWVSSQPFEFLTKATRVSGPWFAPTPSLPCSSCPILGGKFCFSKENSRPIPGESSMSPTPSLQRSCSAECVFVGLGDRVQHSSFCDFCILVIC